MRLPLASPSNLTVRLYLSPHLSLTHPLLFSGVAHIYKFACIPSTLLMQRTFLFINGGVIRVLCGGGVGVVQIFELCEGGKPILSLIFCYCYIIWLYISSGIIRIIISSRKRRTFETQDIFCTNSFSTLSCKSSFTATRGEGGVAVPLNVLTLYAYFSYR